jgi:uncharacterized protein
VFTRRFTVHRQQSSVVASGELDMLRVGSITSGNEPGVGFIMLRRILTTPWARCAAKIGGIFLIGMLGVYVYSKHTAPSDGIDKTVLDLILFAAAALSSISGFAFSALCGAALFHTRMDHIQVVQTMLMSSIAIQSLMIITIWKSIDWLRFSRFLAGGLLGIPFGLFILLHVERHLFAVGVGTLLCAYSAYLILRRPFVISPRLGFLDLPIGFAGGITGGAVAFPGAPVTAWCQLKGWSRDQQRGIYQPYILVMQIVSLSLMPLFGKTTGGPGFALDHLNSVPPALAGALIGIYIYQRSSDRVFSVVINSTLFVSGFTLLF